MDPAAVEERQRAMLAPRPEVMSRGLFRVVRPGGTVGMTAS